VASGTAYREKVTSRKSQKKKYVKFGLKGICPPVVDFASATELEDEGDARGEKEVPSKKKKGKSFDLKGARSARR